MENSPQLPRSSLVEESSGARLAIARLAVPATGVVLALSAAFVLLAGALERRASLALAADRTLTGAVFGIVLPLIAFATLERAAARSRLDTAINGLARHGMNRRRLALGLLAASAFVLSVAGCLLASMGVVVTRAGEAGWLSDLATSAWIGAAAGPIYAAWFLLASTFGKRGGGRPVALAIDWVLGSMASYLAAPWPRGHLRNLLGSNPVLDMPQSAALITLALLGTIYALLALYRLPA